MAEKYNKITMSAMSPASPKPLTMTVTVGSWDTTSTDVHTAAYYRVVDPAKLDLLDLPIFPEPEPPTPPAGGWDEDPGEWEIRETAVPVPFPAEELLAAGVEIHRYSTIDAWACYITLPTKQYQVTVSALAVCAHPLSGRNVLKEYIVRELAIEQLWATWSQENPPTVHLSVVPRALA